VLLIQLYVILLVIEGALPQVASCPPCPIRCCSLRDPVALVICVLGYRSRNLVFDGYMRSLFLLFAGFVGIGALQLINGIGGSPLVIAYGLRTYLLHLPVAFVMARVLNREDLHKILMMFLWMVAPDGGADGRSVRFVAACVGQQRRRRPSRPDLRRRPDGFRPAGTFSFVTGRWGFSASRCAALIAGSVERGLSWAAPHRRMGRHSRSRRRCPAAAAFWRRSPG
jgi:hypothetical protein